MELRLGVLGNHNGYRLLDPYVSYRIRRAWNAFGRDQGPCGLPPRHVLRPCWFSESLGFGYAGHTDSAGLTGLRRLHCLHERPLLHAGPWYHRQARSTADGWLLGFLVRWDREGGRAFHHRYGREPAQRRRFLPQSDADHSQLWRKSGSRRSCWWLRPALGEGRSDNLIGSLHSTRFDKLLATHTWWSIDLGVLHGYGSVWNHRPVWPGHFNIDPTFLRSIEYLPAYLRCLHFASTLKHSFKKDQFERLSSHSAELYHKSLPRISHRWKLGAADSRLVHVPDWNYHWHPCAHDLLRRWRVVSDRPEPCNPQHYPRHDVRDHHRAKYRSREHGF